jgi:hypothetical protein
VNLEFSYAYPADLGLRTVRRYVFRESWRGILIMSGVAVFGLVNLCYTEDPHWIFGAIVTVGLGYDYLWWKHYRALASICTRRANKPVIVKMDEKSITSQVPHWTVAMDWTVVKEMWRRPDVLVLFPEEGGWYMLLPLAAMTAEQRAFIEARVMDNKARIR